MKYGTTIIFADKCLGGGVKCHVQKKYDANNLNYITSMKKHVALAHPASSNPLNHCRLQ